MYTGVPTPDLADELISCCTQPKIAPFLYVLPGYYGTASRKLASSCRTNNVGRHLMFAACMNCEMTMYDRREHYGRSCRPAAWQIRGHTLE